jgi:hypothetical protein
MAGYSSTPLAKKLGLKPGHRLFVIGAPEDYEKLLAPLPADVSISSKPPKDGADIVHLFAPSLAAFEAGLPRARKAMKTDGAVWVSWYKKSSGIETDLTEDIIRARMLAGDLVDVKVCAVSDAWSGLKAVVRKALR